MRIETVRADELGPGELAAWREIQRSDPGLANPFLAPEFALAVAAVRPRVRVAVLRDGCEPAGFFAFERGPLGLGRPLAAGVSDAQGVVARPSIRWDADELLEACGLGVIEFDHLVDGQAPFDGYVRRREASRVVDLSGGYDAYVERRSAESRSFRRALAKQSALGRDHGEVEFELHSSAPDAFAALTAWKSAQYRRTGRADRFARPWIRRLVAGLMATQGEEFSGLLAVLRVGGRPIAVQGCLAGPEVLSLWFPAFDPAWGRYSPGMILRRKVIEAAASRGIRTVDMGKGHSLHKELLGTGEVLVAEARVARRSPAAVAHRLCTEPPRRVERFVLDHPRLRLAARQTLARIGAARSRVGGSAHVRRAAGRSSL